MKRKDISSLRNIEDMQERKAALRKILVKYDPFTDIELPEIDENVEDKLDYYQDTFEHGMSVEYPDESKKYEDVAKFAEDDLPLSKVKTIDCFFNQKTVTIGRLIEILDGKLDSEEFRNGVPHDYPRGSAVDNKYYIADGNHRLMLAKLLDESEFEGYFIPDTLHLIPGLIHPSHWMYQIIITYPDGYKQTLQFANVRGDRIRKMTRTLIDIEIQKHYDPSIKDDDGNFIVNIVKEISIISPYE